MFIVFQKSLVTGNIAKKPRNQGFLDGYTATESGYRGVKMA